MNLLKRYGSIVLAIVFVFGLSLLTFDTSYAVDIFDGVNAAHGIGQPVDLFGGNGVITRITNVLLFIVGALSVIMLIFGGLRYVVSGGNSTAVTAAKNTILYAIVGLVISFLAFAAINFVINSFAPGAASGGTNV